jgi:hypothetical protein
MDDYHSCCREAIRNRKQNSPMRSFDLEGDWA